MGEAALDLAYSSFAEMPPEQRYVWKLAARIRLAREAAARKDVLAWSRAVMPEVFYLPFCMPFHGYLVEIRGLEFTMTKGPRNHAKTAVGDMAIPMFQALEEPEDFNHYLTVQGSEAKALSLNRSIKNELEGNEVIRALYGDVVGDRWTDNQFQLANGVAFTGVSTGTSIRGLLYQNRRPDYIMADDLYDETHIENVEATLKVNDWFWSTLYNARAKTKRWAIKCTGTAINQHDYMTKAEKDAKGNNIVCKTFKTVKDFKTHELLWSELHSVGGRDPWVTVQVDMKRMGSLIFMREQQNEPRDDANSIIKRAWLNKVDGRSWEFDPLDLFRELAKVGTVISISAIKLCDDPSIGKNQKSDFNGSALIIETINDGAVDDPVEAAKGGHDWWIMNAWEARLSLQERVNHLRDVAADQPADQEITECIIEAIGGFDDFAETVATQTDLPVTRVEEVKDKITVLVNVSKFFENGKVHLNKNISEEMKQTIIDQLTTNNPEHDDVRDAITLAMRDSELGGWGKAYD